MSVSHWMLAVILVALLLLLALLAVGPAEAAGPERVTRPQAALADCLDWMADGTLHHALAPWTESAVLSGEFRAWKTGGTTLVIAFRVAECGGRWMFAKFRAGTFTTNFFPDRGWSYIAAQVRGWTACAKSVVVAAVRAAIQLGYTVETVVGLVLIPENVCSLPGSWRLPECSRS